MPCEYLINHAERLVCTTTSGVVTFKEVVAHQDALLADGSFDPTYDQLIDNTRAESFTMTASEAEAIARRKLFSEKSLRAFVADKAVMYGVGRMMSIYYELAVGPDLVGVFRDMKSASEWLRQRPRT